MKTIKLNLGIVNTYTRYKIKNNLTQLGTYLINYLYINYRAIVLGTTYNIYNK